MIGSLAQDKSFSGYSYQFDVGSLEIHHSFRILDKF